MARKSTTSSLKRQRRSSGAGDELSRSATPRSRSTSTTTRSASGRSGKTTRSGSSRDDSRGGRAGDEREFRASDTRSTGRYDDGFRPSDWNPDNQRSAGPRSDRGDWGFQSREGQDSQRQDTGRHARNDDRFAPRSDLRQRSGGPSRGTSQRQRPSNERNRDFSSSEADRRRDYPQGNRPDSRRDYRDDDRSFRPAGERDYGDFENRGERRFARDDFESYRGESNRGGFDDWGHTGRNEQFEPHISRREGGYYGHPDDRESYRPQGYRDYPSSAQGQGRRFERSEGIRQDADFEESDRGFRGDSDRGDRGSESYDDNRYYAGRGQRGDESPRSRSTGRPRSRSRS